MVPNTKPLKGRKFREKFNGFAMFILVSHFNVVLRANKLFKRNYTIYLWTMVFIHRRRKSGIQFLAGFFGEYIPVDKVLITCVPLNYESKNRKTVHTTLSKV